MFQTEGNPKYFFFTLESVHKSSPASSQSSKKQKFSSPYSGYIIVLLASFRTGLGVLLLLLLLRCMYSWYLDSEILKSWDWWNGIWLLQWRYTVGFGGSLHSISSFQSSDTADKITIQPIYDLYSILQSHQCYYTVVIIVYELSYAWPGSFLFFPF